LILFIGTFSFLIENSLPQEFFSSTHNQVASIKNNFGVDCDEFNQMLENDDTKAILSKFKDEFHISKIYDAEKGGRKEPLDIPLRPLLNCFNPDEDYLIEALKKDYLLKPARPQEPYSLQTDKSLEMKSQPQAVDVMEMVYKNKLKNGFFVEAGAADCEFSVSLPLEKHYGWTGVLVETNFFFFKKCQEKRRKSYLINTCLGTKETPHFAEFNFYSAGKSQSDVNAMGGFNGNQTSTKNVFKVQCFNLESILVALHSPKVNLLILDIEGYELAVLRSIRWQNMDIEVISMEMDLAGAIMKDSSPEIIREFMKDKGYTRFRHRSERNPNTGLEQNEIFVRNDIVRKYNVIQL